MNAVVYTAGKIFREGGSWTGWGNETLIAILLKGETTTPDDPDHEFVSDIVADESAATNYARVTLTTVAHAADDTNNRAEVTWDGIDFDDVDAAADTETYVGLIIARDGASDAARRLLYGFPLPNLQPNGTGFVLVPGSNGAVWQARATSLVTP